MDLLYKKKYIKYKNKYLNFINQTGGNELLADGTSPNKDMEVEVINSGGDGNNKYTINTFGTISRFLIEGINRDKITIELEDGRFVLIPHKDLKKKAGGNPGKTLLERARIVFTFSMYDLEPEEMDELDVQQAEEEAEIKEQEQAEALKAGKSINPYDIKVSTDRYKLTEDGVLTINDGIKSINNREFSNRPDIIIVVIPPSVTIIGGWAFYKCTSLVHIEIGNSVTIIGNFAFFACDSLKSVIIGNSVTTIGLSSFAKAGALERVAIPNSVTTIGFGAFPKTTKLTNGWTRQDGGTFQRDTHKKLKQSVLSDDESLPQTLPQTLPQILPQTLPQILPQTLPQTLPQILPQTLPQTLPQILPQTLPQILPPRLLTNHRDIIKQISGKPYNDIQSDIIFRIIYKYIMNNLESQIIDVNMTSSGSFGLGILYTLRKLDSEKQFKIHGKINNNSENSKIENFKNEFKILGKFQHPNILHEINLLYKTKQSEGIVSKIFNVRNTHLGTTELVDYTELATEDQDLEFAIILTEALDDNLNNLSEIFTTTIDIFKFLLIITFTIFYMYNNINFVHSDLKETNITYKKINNEYYYKIIDFSDVLGKSVLTKSTAPIGLENNWTENPIYYDGANHHWGTSGYQPNKGKSTMNYEVTTDKLDMYAIGKILDNILMISPTLKKDPLYSNLIDFKNNLFELDQKLRFTSRQALRYLLQLLPLFDISDRININEYLKTNFTILGNQFKSTDVTYENPDKFEFDKINQKLNTKLTDLITKYETNVFDRCQFSIDKFRKNGYGLDISDAVLKYNICSYIGFDDRIPNGYMDLGSGHLNEFLNQSTKDNNALLNLRKIEGREIIVVDYKVLLPHIMQICFPISRVVYDKNNSQYYNAIAIAEEIHKKYPQDNQEGNIEKIMSSNPLGALNDSKKSHYIEFTKIFTGKDKHFVCRHFGLLYKICCDFVNIPCKRIRGYFSSTDETGNQYLSNNHCWNIIKNDDDNFVLVDLMHSYCGHKICEDNPNSFDDTYSTNYYMPNIPLNQLEFTENIKRRTFVKDVGDKKRILPESIPKITAVVAPLQLNNMELVLKIIHNLNKDVEKGKVPAAYVERFQNAAEGLKQHQKLEAGRR